MSLHKMVQHHGTSFWELAPSAPIGPFRAVVSAAANERYWQAAGVDHPVLRDGALYPPIAANFTVLAFQASCPEPVIQTRQRLVCHRRADAGVELVAEGEIVAAYTKRGRDYVDVRVTVTTADDSAPLWTSEVSFTPAAKVGDRA
jgi:hypothetical protein